MSTPDRVTPGDPLEGRGWDQPDPGEGAPEALEPDPADAPPAEAEYSSPLMSRLQGSRLTLALLQEEIPRVRAGEDAAAALEKATKRMGDKRRSQLAAIVADGKAAKERLFIAALPLIRTIAAREWRRRQQWGSQVSLEDLTQEAIIGFLKGIAGFKTEALGRSPTNYLGQWMLVETRRAAEVLDHDLQVGHDAGERFRRVRALRARLATEYGREPTDEEIAAASRNSEYIVRPGLVGRAPKEGESVAAGKGLTPAQVAEERALRDRVGHASRFATVESEDDAPSVGGTVDPSRDRVHAIGETTGTVDPAEAAIAADTARVVAGLLTAAMDRMGIPDLQRDIIARRYGLPPHTEEASAREIARALSLQRDRVSRVIGGFNEEMTRPGGAFHATIRDLDPDDLRAIGLGWAIDALGSWPKKPTGQPSTALVEEITVVARGGVIATGGGQTKAAGVLGWFVCDFHDRTFSSLYQTRASVPKTRPCPSCQRPSPRARITEH